MDRTIATRTPATQRLHPASHRIVSRRRRVLTRAAATPNDRERVASAFRTQANGVDAATASARTNDFYRSGGMDWARCLG